MTRGDRSSRQLGTAGLWPRRPLAGILELMTPPTSSDPASAAPLRLDTTGQFIGGPVVAPHDNRATDVPFLRRCVSMMERVGAN